MMKIGILLTSNLLEEKGFIIPFSVLARCSRTLLGKNVLDSKGRVIGKVTCVRVDRRNKEIHYLAEINKKLPKGGSLVQIKGRIKDLAMNKVKLMELK